MEIGKLPKSLNVPTPTNVTSRSVNTDLHPRPANIYESRVHDDDGGFTVPAPPWYLCLGSVCFRMSMLRNDVAAVTAGRVDVLFNGQLLKRRIKGFIIQHYVRSSHLQWLKSISHLGITYIPSNNAIVQMSRFFLQDMKMGYLARY